MKIYAFEVRDDEIPYFNRLKEEYGLDLTLSKEILSLEGIENLEDYSYVTVLGLHRYGLQEMEAFKKKHIDCLTTRTIGYNHIDLDAAKECGIHVCNASYAPNGVAEYTIMMILLCLRNYKQALWRSQVNDYSLAGLIGKELRNLTVGVIGTGRIGATVIRCLHGFGCKILAYDQYQNTSVLDYITYVDLDSLYASSDIITLHTPLLPSTYHMINKESIAKMKQGVILINCARGSLMSVDDLIEGIETQHIGALGIDCIENEENIIHKNHLTDILINPQMVYLRQFKNVIHTQHMAFYTEEAVENMVKCGIEGILAVHNGESYPTQLV